MVNGSHWARQRFGASILANRLVMAPHRSHGICSTEPHPKHEARVSPGPDFMPRTRKTRPRRKIHSDGSAKG